ncbi:MAG: type I-C CRISPR-associated protein Cas8c/Csd1 [Oscillospiraceae bacterium]|nr:type I-C CRISPR-associated protein Cas8c/Csd1 [Oscillospiraceae bacterium]
MSWLEKCYETYENCQQEIGIQKFQAEGDKRSYVPLLPVAHTTQLVNIEVELDQNGDFQDARLLAKDEQTTIIPCTEESSARTSGVVPHPLVDKLQYIAADYPAYGGTKKSGWNLYHTQLQDWCSSPYADAKVCAVLRFLEKGCLVASLVKKHILFLDENGKMPAKWTGNKDEKPKILETLASADQTESFVRFRVGGIDLAQDEAVRESFIHYYEMKQQRVDYCTVQGKQMAVSTLSPYKIRNPGDRAKLISSNDSTNYTYRGRFVTAEQALSIGYETTQKAHSALRWLISKQGCSNGDQTVVVWGTKGEPIPDITADSMDLGDDFAAAFAQLGQPQLPPTTESEYAERFNKAIQGYGKALDEKANTVVMILDSATQGRLSIRYYRELAGSELMKNITDWHRNFAWKLNYRSAPESAEPGQKPKWKRVSFWGAPSPADIAKAAYGEKADKKIIQQTVERLVPCITEGKYLPRDLMLSAVHRATAGIGLEPWEYQKTCGIACALICGYYHRNKKEDFVMTDGKYVDETIDDRSYLFGRILACAEQIERRVQSQTGETRPTNAERLRLVFVQRPAKTTALLQQKLTPYLNRMRANGVSRDKRYSTLQELVGRLGAEKYTNKPLNELYLLGYACQMMDFREENAAYNKNTAEE